MDNQPHLCISNFNYMKKFLFIIGLAILFFFSLVLCVYWPFRCYVKHTNKYENDNIFVWGDSQMYQGLDLMMLNNLLDIQILTSAVHGGGIYDFLVSEKNIPDNSRCIISFPETALLRNPLKDYNRTGYELSCLCLLFRNECPLDECLRIEHLNRRNWDYKLFYYKAFHNHRHLIYEYADSLVYPEPLELLSSMFLEVKECFEWKSKSYKEGIQHLFDKHSQIILVQFPYDEQLEAIAEKSTNRYLTDSLKKVLINDYALKYKKVVLTSDSLLMHDLTHLNEIGARLTTMEIAEILKRDTVNNYFVDVKIEYDYKQ